MVFERGPGAVAEDWRLPVTAAAETALRPSPLGGRGGGIGA